MFGDHAQTSRTHLPTPRQKRERLSDIKSVTVPGWRSGRRRGFSLPRTSLSFARVAQPASRGFLRWAIPNQEAGTARGHHLQRTSLASTAARTPACLSCLPDRRDATKTASPLPRVPRRRQEKEREREGERRSATWSPQWSNTCCPGLSAPIPTKVVWESRACHPKHRRHLGCQLSHSHPWRYQVRETPVMLLPSCTRARVPAALGLQKPRP